MPIRKTANGWKWGTEGKTYKNKKDVIKQAQAAYASGYKEGHSQAAFTHGYKDGQSQGKAKDPFATKNKKNIKRKLSIQRMKF